MFLRLSCAYVIECHPTALLSAQHLVDRNSLETSRRYFAQNETNAIKFHLNFATQRFNCKIFKYNWLKHFWWARAFRAWAWPWAYLHMTLKNARHILFPFFPRPRIRFWIIADARKFSRAHARRVHIGTCRRQPFLRSHFWQLLVTQNTRTTIPPFRKGFIPTARSKKNAES